MIQRIQTIFLLLAAGTFAALLSFPFATRAIEPQGIFSDGKYSIRDNLFLEIISSVGLVFAILCMFLYKKREVQIKMGYGVILLCLFVLVTAILYFTNAYGPLTMAGVQEGPGWLMPLAGIIFTASAMYYIRKDEQLVKSMDRLR